MFKDKPSSAIVAVSDLARAKAFYAETLGLELDGEMEGVLAFRTGATRLVVYPSSSAGTNKATPWSGTRALTSTRSMPS